MSFFKNLFRSANVKIFCDIDQFRFVDVNETTVLTFLHIDEVSKKIIAIGSRDGNIGQQVNAFTEIPSFQVLSTIMKWGVGKAINSKPNTLVRPKITFYDLDRIPQDLFQKLLLNPNLSNDLKALKDPSKLRIRFFQDIGFFVGAREVTIITSESKITANRQPHSNLKISSYYP